MKKYLSVCFIISAFVASFLFSATIPDKEVKIKKIGKKRSAVFFSHKKHTKIEKADDCDSCHNAVKFNTKAHKLCIGCHKKIKSGPVKCNDCHKI